MDHYKNSGVDIKTADKFIGSIKEHADSTKKNGVIGGIGGFGGLFDLKKAGFKDPILVSATDGVGTKLKISQATNVHNTIGIDLVAMCVNDILAQGAKPLFFLDYLAVGKLNLTITNQIIEGIANGCKEADVALIGGETAEMPGCYNANEYDLAGFAVGATNYESLLPKKEKIEVGDKIVGFFSNGIHANGFSLVRDVLKKKKINYGDPSPWGNINWGNILLTPTKIYTNLLVKEFNIAKALAHITGGGIIDNLPRVLPDLLGATIDINTWKIPEIFGWIMKEGLINMDEMFNVFNMGIGMIMVTDDNGLQILNKNIKQDSYAVIGEITQRKSRIIDLQI